MAALKRKRKKFSDSRRAGADARAAAGPEALQRASSVPARPPPPPGTRPRAAPPPPASVSPSTTAESVAGRGGSREPLLASLDDDAHKVGRDARDSFDEPARVRPTADGAETRVDDSQEACGRCGYEAGGTDEAGEADAGAGEGAPCGRCAALARLAGVTPLHGHAPHHSAGWL